MAQQQPKTQHCMVCGEALHYNQSPQAVSCQFCGQAAQALIVCPEGHYVCDHCHGAKSLDLLPHFADKVRGEAPEDILEELFALPNLPMHGPEHHPLVALALLLAAQKAGAVLPENFVSEAIRRGMQVPGGACGYLGSCGAGISLGIAASLLSGATPLKGPERGLANRASAVGLLAVSAAPRCCKREMRNVVRRGREFLDQELGLSLPQPAEASACREVGLHRECLDRDCPYHPVTR